MPLALLISFQAYNSTTSFTIEVTNASFDGLQTLNVGSQSTGAGAGKVTFNPFSFTKRPDVNTPDFFKRMCSGTPYQKVVLSAYTTDSKNPFLIYAMGLAAIKTVSFAGSEIDGTATEVVTMEYGQAGYSIAPQNPDGSFGAPVTAGWDRVKNVSIDFAKVGA
jgi:type VI secretion system secreted protein Hcp